ncbi:MAG: hypothetical protein IAG13_11165 [Deltaproteobacteria bacterium]|nr:hypothetical protein [Nannocystaceae bacterium]
MEVRIPVSAWRRTIAWLVGRLARLHYGYEVPFVDTIVRQHGWRAACRRLAALGRTLTRIEQRFGERDGHLLLAFSAVWHGCLACAVGHVRAANLAHFHLTGELSPLDESMLPDLLGVRDSGAHTRFSALCTGGQIGSLGELLARQSALHDGTLAVVSDEDELLRSSLDAYDGSDRSPLAARTAVTIPRLSHRARDLDLCGRYELARRRERLTTGPLPTTARAP